MKRLVFLAAILLPLFLFTSCVPETPTPTTPLDMKEFMEGNIQKMRQNFTVDAAEGGSVYGSEGTELRFVANSFIDANGNVITGDVDVSLLEIYDKASMIFTNKQTLADIDGNSEIIASGGEFEISLSQDGEQVFLRWNALIVTKEHNNPVNPGMMAFDGVLDQAGNVTWSAASNTVSDSADTYVVYYMFPRTRNWINIDYLWNINSNPGIDFPIKLPTEYNMENTGVWASINGINSVLTLYSSNSGNIFQSNLIPEDTDMNIVIVHNDEGTFSYAIVPITVTPTTDITVDEADFIEATEDQIRKAFQGLP